MRKTFLLTAILAILIGNALKSQQSSSLIEAKIDSILPLLSLEEKVAMCHAQSKFSSPGVPRLGIPEIWMSDGPHGVRAEISWDAWSHAGWTNDSITAFPALTCLAASFNPELSYDYGFSLGEESRYRRKDVILGPGVNIYRTPLNGRNFEYMGEDPFLASVLVVPYIKGVQKSGVAACVKHYVLNNQEMWRGHINVEVSDRALHEIYLPAFKAAVQEGNVWSIMGAYNQFRGQHCCHNEILLNNILKQDWKFDGVVITDWGATHDTKEAAFNGLDIEMGTGTNGLTTSRESAYNFYYLANPFLSLLRSGEVPEDVLDDKVRRILRLMYRTNMANRPIGRMNNIEHQQVARSVATNGIVLLKNDDDFFPVTTEKPVTIAVIGENATRRMTIGGGSSELKAKYEISPLEGIKNRFKNATILHTMGYASGHSAFGREIESELNADSLVSEAKKIAKQADIILFIGGLNKNHFQDCEGGDRVSYGLPFGQEDLINQLSEINENLGVILISGNAVELEWLPKAKGLLQAWYLGSEAGNAIADIISGDVNPSGKLPFSFPKKLEDNAAHSFGELSYPGDNVNVHYKEDILVGYRWHDTKNIEPQFAFGFGLSYTTFEIGNVATDKKEYKSGEQVKLSCNVSNTGQVDGATVVQVYVGKQNSKVDRAKKELKGFSKLMVTKGAESELNITIDVDKLAFYNEAISDWELEKGEYTLYVGEASNDISEELQITIK